MTHAFVLWYEHPRIAELYIDQIVTMCHTIFHEKMFDPLDRIYRDEYLFGSLLLFLSTMFQQTSKFYQAFKWRFIQKLFAMIDANCDESYLDIIHQRTWNIFWHLSQFVTLQNGFDAAQIEHILNFLCNLCFNNKRSLSSTQRQWITLSIIRIIVQTPQCISILFKEHKIFHRKANSHIWLMYALGDSACKLVQKYGSQTGDISKEFICETLENIICILAPYATNNYGLIRTTSAYFFYECVRNLLAINPKSKMDAIALKMYESMRDLPDCIKLRKRLKKCFEWLDRGACDAVNDEVKTKNEDEQIESKLLRMSRNKSCRETECLQEEIVEKLLSEHPVLQLSMTKEIMWLIKHRIGSNVGFSERLSSALSSVLLSTFEYYTETTLTTEAKDSNCGGGGLIGYQRKLDPLVTEYYKLLQTERVMLEGDDEEGSKRFCCDLVVVASLLEKPTNLGGISRTCEIFGVSEMIVHDLRVLKRADFKSLSVSSEEWLPISQVPKKELIGYLKKQKEKHNYCIIGLEQTTKSVPLNEMKFVAERAKCVIVVGREKTGLPPEIINECDVCVEIPQFGVVRSLNAHVSFAIILWEYVKQQLK